MGRSTTPRKVLIYADHRGNEPFSQWLNRLRNENSRRRIHARLRRLEQGNFGDCKHLKMGVFELRLYFGVNAGQSVVVANEVVALVAGASSSGIHRNHWLLRKIRIDLAATGHHGLQAFDGRVGCCRAVKRQVLSRGAGEQIPVHSGRDEYAFRFLSGNGQ